MFIDATYEGDLMAAAGVAYHVGREANSVYDEHGMSPSQRLASSASFWRRAEKDQPHMDPRRSSSGLLPRISLIRPANMARATSGSKPTAIGSAPHNIRESNPLSSTEGYDPKQYELMIRLFEAGWKDVFGKFDAIPNRKPTPTTMAR